jgi:hypothetical protein
MATVHGVDRAGGIAASPTVGWIVAHDPPISPIRWEDGTMEEITITLRRGEAEATLDVLSEDRRPITLTDRVFIRLYNAYCDKFASRPSDQACRHFEKLTRELRL